jgi:hypothetical protein
MILHTQRKHACDHVSVKHVFNQFLTKFLILDFSNLVVRINFCIKFETKHWKHIFGRSFGEAKYY